MLIPTLLSESTPLGCGSAVDVTGEHEPRGKRADTFPFPNSVTMIVGARFQPDRRQSMELEKGSGSGASTTCGSPVRGCRKLTRRAWRANLSKKDGSKTGKPSP
jgi:hypothetical protein